MCDSQRLELERKFKELNTIFDGIAVVTINHSLDNIESNINSLNSLSRQISAIIEAHPNFKGIEDLEKLLRVVNYRISTAKKIRDNNHNIETYEPEPEPEPKPVVRTKKFRL